MTTSKETKNPAPLFSVAFRPFFLSGAVFSVIALIAWASVLNGLISFTPYVNSFWWHAHEMLFGFVAAIVVGFLLTAVQNWTGQISVRGSSLVLLWALWLLARVTLALDLGLASWLLVLIDLAFLPAAGLVLARLIIRAKLWRNLIFVPVISLMTIANGLMHWGGLNDSPELINQGSYAMVMLVILLITVLGGRVFPMFTANGTGTKKVESVRIIEIFTIVTTMIIALVYLSGIVLPAAFQGALLMFAALCHFIRLLRWRFWVTFKAPLVWSIHLGYFGIPIGFFMMGLHYLMNNSEGGFLLSTTLHSLTVGAIGTTILAMITRVSLGHTGRKLIAGKVMASAFLVVCFAFILRVFYPLLNGDYALIMGVSAALWSVAFGAYAIIFMPKLLAKRV